MHHTTQLALSSLMAIVLCAGSSSFADDAAKDPPLPTRIVLNAQPVGIRMELVFANDAKRTLTETLTNTRTGKVFDSRTSTDYKLTLYAEGDVPYGLATTCAHLDCIPYTIANGKRHVYRFQLEADGKMYGAIQLWQRLAKADSRFRLHIKPPRNQEK